MHECHNSRNYRILMNHFGGIGVLEAIWYQVPVLGISHEGDHMDTEDRIIYRGIGRSFDYAMSVEDIRDTINEVIGNPKYQKNIQHLSFLARNQENPLQRAVWLVEYVAKTKGKAAHFANYTRYFIES